MFKRLLIVGAVVGPLSAALATTASASNGPTGGSGCYSYL